MSKKPEEVLGELLRRGSARSRLLGLNNAKAEMREWIKTMSRKRLVNYNTNSQITQCYNCVYLDKESLPRITCVRFKLRSSFEFDNGHKLA